MHYYCTYRIRITSVLIQQMNDSRISYVKIRQNCKLGKGKKTIFFESLPKPIGTGNIIIKCKRPKENLKEEKVELFDVGLHLLNSELELQYVKNLEIPNMENNYYNGYLFLSEIEGFGLEINLNEPSND